MLRTRILLGTAPLLILIMAVGGYAVWLFVRLGGAVNATLRENYLSIAMMQEFKDAALMIDRALALNQAGAATAAETRAAIDVQSALERHAADVELHNVTEPGEGELAARLDQQSRAFLQAAAAAIGAAPNTPGASLHRPALAGALETAAAIQKLNEAAMTRVDRHARETAARSTRIMLLAIAATLPLGLFFAFRLSRSILAPLKELTTFARELGEGNLDQVVPVPSRDELGQLADAFNKMAGKLRLYRQATTDEILRARQTTEMTFAALPDPIFVLDEDGTVEYRNAAAERLGRKLSMADADLPIVGLARTVLEGGSDYVPDAFGMAICLRIDERETFFLPRVIGFRDENGATVGAAAVLQDVTRFRLMDEVKSNLVATVSHELKNPLTSIRMVVYLLLEERIGTLNAKQTELLLAARDDADRLFDLIDNLLDLARLEAGAATTGERRTAVDPVELARRAVVDNRELLAAGGVSLREQLEPGLPRVLVAPEQIGHVFSNLLSNAAKHSPAGETITICGRRQGPDAVRFSVVDHGSGVPPAERERIFERFYRMPGEQKGGAGLGLAICREIVRAQGGAIGVGEAPGGKGSEFFFVVPAEAAPV